LAPRQKSETGLPPPRRDRGGVTIVAVLLVTAFIFIAATFALKFFVFWEIVSGTQQAVGNFMHPLAAPPNH
jgi:hypothetical protein